MTKTPRGQTPEQREYQRQYRATHPKRDRRAYKKEYDEKNKLNQQIYRMLNADKFAARAKEYYQKNREHILATVKARADANPEAISIYQAEYYRKHTELVKANVKAYQKANPEITSLAHCRRRTRKADNGGSHTIRERREKFAELGNICFWCDKAEKLTADHLIPISKGGSDDIVNIVPSCRSCNSQKSDKMPSEYFIYRRQILELTGQI